MTVPVRLACMRGASSRKVSMWITLSSCHICILFSYPL
jgi:hypothetical protein